MEHKAKHIPTCAHTVTSTLARRDACLRMTTFITHARTRVTGEMYKKDRKGPGLRNGRARDRTELSGTHAYTRGVFWRTRVGNGRRYIEIRSERLLSQLLKKRRKLAKKRRQLEEERPGGVFCDRACRKFAMEGIPETACRIPAGDGARDIACRVSHLS